MSGRLTNGAVAGIVIAIAIFVFLATLAMTLFILRLKRSRSRPLDTADNNGKTDDNSKRHGSSQIDENTAAPGLPPIARFDKHLPPSEDDYTIQNSVKEVFDQISIHVDNYYKASTPRMTRDSKAELEAFASCDLRVLIDLLQARHEKSLSIIKHLLVCQVLQRILPACDPDLTLLPSDFVILPHTLERTHSLSVNGMFLRCPHLTGD